LATGVHKAFGVKQGYPAYPQLFNNILDCATAELKTQLKEKYNISLYLGALTDMLVLPLLLAYADDIFIVSRNYIQLLYIIEEFIPILSAYGLEINGNKSGIVIKDYITSAQTHVKINDQLTLPMVISIKYLGVTIPSDMSRRDSIRSLIKGSTDLPQTA
jgi:hypothetical protein